MNRFQTGVFYLSAQPAGPIPDFPRELRRSLGSRFEPRFMIILAVITLMVFPSVLLLSMRRLPATLSNKEIRRIQERYARLVLNQPLRQLDQKAEKLAKGKGAAGEQVKKEPEKAAPKKETFVEREERREATAAQRRAEREKVGREIRNIGIFAAITAVSDQKGDGRSGAVRDFLGAAADIGNLQGIGIGKGTFAARNDIDPASLKGSRGTRTTGVDIQRESVGRVAGAVIEASGSVNITTKPPEMSDASGGSAVSTSKACIQAVVNRESARLKRVFENWLKRDPTLGGLLEIKFTIQTSGAISSASVHRSTTNNASFDQNIVRYVERWDFSSCSIASPIEVVYPFVFEGQSGQ